MIYNWQAYAAHDGPTIFGHAETSGTQSLKDAGEGFLTWQRSAGFRKLSTIGSNFRHQCRHHYIPSEQVHRLSQLLYCLLSLETLCASQFTLVFQLSRRASLNFSLKCFSASSSVFPSARESWKEEAEMSAWLCYHCSKMTVWQRSPAKPLTARVHRLLRSIPRAHVWQLVTLSSFPDGAKETGCVWNSHISQSIPTQAATTQLLSLHDPVVIQVW